MKAPSTTPNPTSAAPYLLTGHFQIARLEEAYAVSEFLAQSCPNPGVTLVGISEILVNAIEHGNLGISSEEKSQLQLENRWLEEIERRLTLKDLKNKTVEIEVTRTKTELCLRVTDQGKGFDWKQYQDRECADRASTHGRGILLATKLAFKSIVYAKNGSEVTGVISLV